MIILDLYSQCTVIWETSEQYLNGKFYLKSHDFSNTVSHILDIYESCIIIMMTTIVLIQVKTVSHDVAQMTRLLYTVNALINNPNLFLEPQSYVS